MRAGIIFRKLFYRNWNFFYNIMYKKAWFFEMAIWWKTSSALEELQDLL